MTADYDIAKEDFIAYNLYHHRHSPTARRQYLRAWILPAIVWLFLCSALWYLADRNRGTPWRTFLHLSPLFSTVPLQLIIFPWAYKRKLRRTVDGMASEGRNDGLFGHHRVEISPERVIEFNQHGQTSSSWHAVEQVAATEDYAYIYINAMAALIVPRRAFASPSEFDEFVRSARNYHAAARANS